ncbi:MAG: tRNA (adenosine(37)-N6)-threonylcarbamoyltransferase complex dimerization subunit type 1 TsaB [Fusobacteriaceae bacterium]|jgi:N6-L-threonylcarbamoyladenine synthase|nr:tRNA (adenosine(37)-N6)-threonylcarbamoyltransferase complex dimerization subunit type 1 TsaB [Fusobacteriaceae bacterium]
MLVLAIDTATKIGSVALYHSEDGLLGEININARTNHSAIIMNLIKQIFLLTGYKVDNVDRIAVTVGPGSFTGIRIGIAVAKGLAYSLDKEIVGMNQLDMIANLCEYRKEEIIPMIDAKNNRAYYSKYHYQNKENIVRDMEYSVGDITNFFEVLNRDKSYVFVGDGAINNKDLIHNYFNGNEIIFSDVNSIPKSSIVGKMAIQKMADNLYTLEAFYMNKPQAERMKDEKSEHYKKK